jgi:glyoxylase-like metal-dependent hydrolase (beta-lactamase superfamily II)
MDRRTFVRSTLTLAAMHVVAPSILRSQQPTPAVAFKDLRKGVGLFTGRGGTIGWYIDKDALVVVDTQMPETAPACLAGLAERTPRSIDLLINSHHHFDHTGGNGVFKPKTKRILAHANVPALQKAAAERMNRLEGQVYATEIYEKDWKEELGKETVHLHYWGSAHTNGDSIIHFEKANVVHTGDLVFNRVAPVIDTQGGSSVENWIVVLERLHKDLSDDTIFIFGHGSEANGVTGKRADLLAMRDYLTALLQFVRKGVQAGLNIDSLATASSLPGFEAYAAGNLVDRFRGGIRQTYQQLVPAAR